MTKEEIVNSILKAALKNKKYDLISLIYKCMTQYADQESEKKSISFGSWLKETILDGDIDTLYQYFLEKIYNK